MVNRLKLDNQSNEGGSDAAAIIAMKSVIFLASDAERLERFCGLSGMLEQDLKQNLTVPQFQGFVLDYLLQDETLLVEFAAVEQLRPEQIMSVRRKLPGFSE